MNLVEIFLPADHSTTDAAFLLCAIAGTAFFALKVGSVALGGTLDGEGHDVSHTPGDTGDLHGDSHGDHHADHGHDNIDTFDALKLLSVNSIAAFFSMFGWAGLSAHVQFGMNMFVSSLIAFLVGTAAMVGVAYLAVMMRKLTSSGAAFQLQDAVGKEAEVYERIPAAGRGKVHITIHGMLRELEAESASGTAIDSFQIVKVTGLKGQTHVLVEPLAAA